MSPVSVQSSISLPGPFRGVVFDMDGLLVHTERQWLQAKVELFRRHGHELTDVDRARVFGAADLQTAVYFTERFGLDEARVPEIRREYMDIVGSLIDAGVEVTAGAEELVERLAGDVPIALASNTRRPLVDRVLAQVSFGGRFGAIATGDEVPPKPAPDVYQLACRRIGVDPSTAAAVEDSPTGVTAARAAGLVCIGVPSDPQHPLTQADHVVRSLTELL